MQPASPFTLDLSSLNSSVPPTPAVTPKETDSKLRQFTLNLPVYNGEIGTAVTGHSPWNLPKKSYNNERAIFRSDELALLKKNGEQQWILADYSFDGNSAEGLKEYLMSPSCHVRSIKFYNCAWDANFAQQLCIGLTKNKSILELHIEGGIFSKEIGTCFKDALANGCYTLRTLNLVNVVLPVEAFQEVVEGIIAQNTHVTDVIGYELSEVDIEEPFFLRVCQRLGIDSNVLTLSLSDVLRNLMLENENPQIDKTELFRLLIEEMVGVRTLSMEGCRLGVDHSPALKELIEESQRLRCLNLQGNRLGSSSSGMKAESPIDRVRPNNEPLVKSNCVVAIGEALAVNTTLSTLILSSNRINATDWNHLHSVIYEDEEERAVNSTVTINLTNNMLEGKPSYSRLITRGSSPRSDSCREEVADSRRIRDKSGIRYSSLKAPSDLDQIQNAQMKKVQQVLEGKI